DVARALDRERHFALVQRAVSADAPRDDLAALGDEVLERLRVLVVDDLRLVRAELAYTLLAATTAAGSVGVEIRSAAEILVVIHHRHDSSPSPPAAVGSLLIGASSASGDASASSPKSSSPRSARMLRGASGPRSMRPRARSRDSSFSSSGGSSRRSNLISAG